MDEIQENIEKCENQIKRIEAKILDAKDDIKKQNYLKGLRESLIKQRDSLQAQLDREQEVLSQIESIYNSISDCTIEELEGKIDSQLSDIVVHQDLESQISPIDNDTVYTGAAIGNLIFGRKRQNDGKQTEIIAQQDCKAKSEYICRGAINKFQENIKDILRKNAKTTNYTLEIIQLLAPAIAQQFGGLSSMAIVGSITILCKQGIQNYIQ